MALYDSMGQYGALMGNQRRRLNYSPVDEINALTPSLAANMDLNKQKEYQERTDDQGRRSMQMDRIMQGEQHKQALEAQEMAEKDAKYAQRIQMAPIAALAPGIGIPLMLSQSSEGRRFGEEAKRVGRDIEKGVKNIGHSIGKVFGL